MSINITVHGSPVRCAQNRKFLLDEERARNELIHKRRKLRLEQVRQKSKELASQVRKNVELEKKKQFQKIEDTKERELQKWREKTICQKQNQYQSNILHVGEAHRAAEAECASGKFCRPCTAGSPQSPEHKFDKWGDVRPTEPTPKKRKVPAQSMTYRHFCQEKVKKKAKKLCNKENSSDFVNMRNKNKQSPTHIYPNVQVQHMDGSSTDDSVNLNLKLSPLRKNSRGEKCTLSPSSSDNKTRSPCKRVNSRLLYEKKCKSKMMKTPSVILEIDSECDSSELDMEDMHEITNMKFSRVSSKTNDLLVNTSENKESYNASDYKPTDSSTDQVILRKTRFTQISDLIKQQDCTQSEDNIKKADLRDSICHEPERKTPSPRGSPKKCKDAKSGDVNKRKSPDLLKRTSNLKSVSKVSTKTDSSQPANRVQFFDYCNKFEKRYDHPNVVKIEQKRDQLNAMEQAELELHSRTLKLEELEKLRQKCEIRSQKALEREQIRRDYEALTAKLDSIAKEKIKSHEICDDAHLFSEARLKQVGIDRQSKMNTAIENVLKRPVLITCPEIENCSKVIPTDNIKKPSAKDINLASYEKTTKDEINNLNSSDSCTSILLNYVDSQSKMITEDIGNCDNSEKIKKLKELLIRINCLRKKLLEELEKTNEKGRTPDIKDVVQDISVLRKERERILLGNEREKQLVQREKKLKKKETILEQKLKEFYEMCKNRDQLSSSSESGTILLSPTKIKANKPVEIIIKLKDDQPQKKTPLKSPRKRASLINLQPRKKFKTPKKTTCNVSEKEVQTAQQTEDISSSTSYRSPPKDIGTILNTFLEKCTTSKVEPVSTKVIHGNSRPQESSKDTPKLRHTVAADSSKKCSNPLLGHYIQRLLGMSRHSIEMLGVSSTEVDTPSSSIINTPANKSITEIGTDQRERIDRIEQFIKDNYSFLSEVEESLKTNNSSSTDSSLKAIEEVWKRILKRKERDKQKKAACKTLKPILKRDAEKMAESEKSFSEISSTKTKKHEDPDKIELVNKYTELTDNCTQRIAELTEMINKVRQEKQKILEITLSSGSASARSTTEYVDFAEKNADKSEYSDHSKKLCDERVLAEENEKNRLEKNKLTGVSRDSGISMSRPLTALDFRESPGMQICDKLSSSPQDAFEPFLKDIPKPGKPSSISMFPFQISSQKPVDVSGDKHKKGKPPVSITRYSPQLNEDVHHELSTILEVDTSATPRPHIPKMDKPASNAQLSRLKDDNTENICYKHFPTFEEYAKSKQLDLTHLEPDVSLKLQLELQELLRLSNTVADLQYKDFPGETSSIQDRDDDIQESIENLIESLKLLNLSVKRFPTHQEYLDKLGASNLISSKSIESSDSDKKGSTRVDSVASIESLPDVVEELIRRNIIKHSFRNENGEGIDSQNSLQVKTSTESGKPENTSQSSQKNIQFNLERVSLGIKSKGASPPKSNIDGTDGTRKTASKDDDLLSGVEMLQFSSNQSNSDGIEKDLDRMGMKWASLMLRKSQKSQETGTSSTSSSFVQQVPRKKSPRKHDHSSKFEDKQEQSSHASLKDSTHGRPLNLREFLAKELQKRTQTSSCSSLTDDSIASQILRSLLGSGNSTPTLQTSSNEARNSEQQNRILTSTPVLMRSASPSKPSTSTGSQKLFKAESISSVRYSNSSSDSKSNPDRNSLSKDDDNLVAPNVRLEGDQD